MVQLVVLLKKMHTIEGEPEQLISTRIRYHRANRLLRQVSKHSISSLQSILQDHINYPEIDLQSQHP